MESVQYVRCKTVAQNRHFMSCGISKMLLILVVCLTAKSARCRAKTACDRYLDTENCNWEASKVKALQGQLCDLKAVTQTCTCRHHTHTRACARITRY